MMFWMAYGTSLKRTGCLEPFDETESLPLTDIPCSGIFQVSVANWFGSQNGGRDLETTFGRHAGIVPRQSPRTTQFSVSYDH